MAFAWELTDGKKTQHRLGDVDAPSTLSITRKDAEAVLAGELSLAVAFMQGKCKVVGEMEPVLDLLAAPGDVVPTALRSLVELAG